MRQESTKTQDNLIFKEDSKKKLDAKLKEIVFESEIAKTFQGKDKSTYEFDYKKIDKEIIVSFSEKDIDGRCMAFSIFSYFLNLEDTNAKAQMTQAQGYHKIFLSNKQLSVFGLTFETLVQTQQVTIDKKEESIDVPSETSDPIKAPDSTQGTLTSKESTDGPDETKDPQPNQDHASITSCNNTKYLIVGSAATAALGVACAISTKAALTHTAIMLGAALSISPFGAAVIAGITGAALIGIVGFTLYKVYQHNKSLSNVSKQKLLPNPNSIFEPDPEKDETHLPVNATFPPTPPCNN